MAPEDRLQPSLLDRLTDDEPQSRQESRDRRVMSFDRIREAVIRDLNWLLNASRLGTVQDLSAFPQVERSVLNYGFPGLAGQSISSLSAKGVEALLRDAILEFEPRILAEGLEVRAYVDRDKMNLTALRIDIRGSLWAQPVPQELFLRTEVDLETGHFKVNERGAASAS